MSRSLALRAPRGPEPASGSPAADGTIGDVPAAVLPSPLHTLGAATIGVLAGLAAIYLVASRLAGTLDAVAAIIAIFAVTMSGPRVHARAGTEFGRMLAVSLQSIAFGAALGGLLILT